MSQERFGLPCVLLYDYDIAARISGISCGV